MSTSHFYIFNVIIVYFTSLVKRGYLYYILDELIIPCYLSALEHAIYLAKMYQDNYPERLKSAHIINGNGFFSDEIYQINLFCILRLFEIHFRNICLYSDMLFPSFDYKIFPFNVLYHFLMFATSFLKHSC